jgi:hypothetical protein
VRAIPEPTNLEERSAVERRSDSTSDPGSTHAADGGKLRRIHWPSPSREQGKERQSLRHGLNSAPSASTYSSRAKSRGDEIGNRVRADDFRGDDVRGTATTPPGRLGGKRRHRHVGFAKEAGGYLPTALKVRCLRTQHCRFGAAHLAFGSRSPIHLQSVCNPPRRAPERRYRHREGASQLAPPAGFEPATHGLGNRGSSSSTGQVKAPVPVSRPTPNLAYTLLRAVGRPRSPSGIWVLRSRRWPAELHPWVGALPSRGRREKEHRSPDLCARSRRRASSLCATVVAGRRGATVLANVVFVNIDATKLTLRDGGCTTR